MLEFLMSTSIGCHNAEAIMLRIQKNQELPPSIKIELLEEIKEYEPDCQWDAKAN